jgi:hypothetical protein
MTETVDAEAPEIRVFHRPTGWTIPTLEPDPQDCTSNFHREQAGQPPCTDTAVWKVVEHRNFGLTLSFWCDTDLPTEHRHQAAHPTA